MQHISDFPHETIEEADLGIIMSDGCRLSARIWMPKNAGKDMRVPAILEHLPYRKRDGTIVRDEYTHPWFAGNGYACIRVDMRGNGESEGLMQDEYLEQELQDACEVIEWISDQEWSNGNVGMMGISWGGFNCLQVAQLAPPALKAVISICSTADRYADDIHYKGGCVLGENFGWAVNMLSYSSRPPDPKLVGDDKWLDMWKHRLHNMPYNWKEWFEHQQRDAYWKHGSVCEDYSSIKAAVLSIGGWHDGYRNTISHLVENISAPVKGIVGPWNHKYPHYAGPKPAIGFLQEAKRWWGKWLNDEETGVEHDPAYRAYLMDSIKPQRWVDERPGHWIKEDQWPSENIQQNKFFLSNEGLQSKAASIEVSIQSPQDCGLMGGEYFPFAFSDELPDEQSFDDQRSACFDGETSMEAMHIVGAPRFKAKLRCDKPNGHICVRLCDVRPDGTSAMISYGVFNLTHHNSHETPEPLTPNAEIEVEFALDQIAYNLPSGHKLRIAISTAYWPAIWPSPEDTNITILSGSISVPLRPISNEAEWQFEEPQAAPAWEHEVLREPSYSRKIDMQDGRSVMTINIDSGKNKDLHHGLISGSTTDEIWSIDPKDSNSATCEIVWQQTGGREGQMWRTTVDAKMWSDADTFYSKAIMICYLNDEIFYEKTFNEKALRKLV